MPTSSLTSKVCLLVVPCLGLVWPGPALPARTTGRLRRPAAAAPPLLLLLLLARQARQAQARPSQGKAQQASQKSAACRQPPGPRAQGCASRARNPKGPQITPFCHQMGRHPTIWDARHGFLHRISARISLDRSRPLNLNFCFCHFWTTKIEKCYFW